MNVKLNDSGTYPPEHIDLKDMNRVIRHRLRNLCCGMKMALERVSDQTRESHPGIGDNCVVMRSELDDILNFTQRMDLLFEQLPLPVPMAFFQLVGQCKLDFGETSPNCTLNMPTPDLHLRVLPGSLVLIALNELLANAADAATDGKVTLSWDHGKGLKFIVENTSELCDTCAVDTPPRPFVAHRGNHEGLGLAIVQRIADAIGGRFQFKQNPKTGKTIATIRIPVRHLEK